MRRLLRHHPAFTFGLHVLLAIAAMVSLVPMLWVVCASLKRGDDLFTFTFLPWPHLDRLTTANFVELFSRHEFGYWLFNSIFLASTQTILLVGLSSLGGFALAKYEFRGKQPLQLLMLITLLLPAQVSLPGSYELICRLGWANSYLAIVTPGAISVFGVFLFRQAMRGVPDELIQAARVDGCGEFRLWWNIALPAVRPMIGAYTLMCFLGTWNGFLWPSIVLFDQDKFTLTMGLANMAALKEFQTNYGVLMAGTLVSILPVVILFIALQKDFVAGLMQGAIKG